MDMPDRTPSVLAAIDHTALAADTTAADVDRLCEEAVTYGFAGVCVATSWLPQTGDRLTGSNVLRVAVVGFPLGASTTRVKVFETQEAIRLGADEVDMVVHGGWLRQGDLAAVEAEIRAVVEAADGRGVKAILETAHLDVERMAEAAEAAQHAGARFVKTSTGFGRGGATIEAVRALRAAVGPELGVKASGGIRTLDAARAMLRAGATRLGTSSGVAIARELEAASPDTGPR